MMGQAEKSDRVRGAHVCGIGFFESVQIQTDQKEQETTELHLW